MFSRSNIDLNLFRTIQLYIDVARAAVVEGDPTAKALLLLSQADHLQDAKADPILSAFLENIASKNSDLDLAAELYNGHLWNNDPAIQRRNLLAATIAHFESHKPHDKMAAFANTANSSVQINFGTSQRNAGLNYYEK